VSAHELRLWLAMLAGDEPEGGALLEVRYRLPAGRGMGQCFHDARRGAALVETIEGLGRTTDVYVGCAPRERPEGGAAAVRRAWVLWADCDGPDAAAAVRAFAPPPSYVVRSGSRANRHAYWSLREPIDAGELRAANVRLAHALGADPRATDAARILRAPATRNHKHDPPAPVVCDELRIDGPAYVAADVLDGLPDPPAAQRPAGAHDALDVLRTIAPPVYVAALTGLDVGSGKIACPFHDDRTPSLHVYDSPEQGWHCYGCGRGGTIIDFGAALYRIEPRGRGYREIRERLAADLLRAVR
jgi:hypothetical protein